MARAADPGLKRYLRGKLDQARWIVDAVEQRRTTLLRVSRALFASQRAFLEHGPGHLAPLRMQEVADACGIHRSTVSRAVAGKHAWTPWGVFALKHFFQAAVGEEPASDGAPRPGAAARCDVRELVRQVVDAEDKRAPLSDDQIVEALAARGQRLARRDVFQCGCVQPLGGDQSCLGDGGILVPPKAIARQQPTKRGLFAFRIGQTIGYSIGRLWQSRQGRADGEAFARPCDGGAASDQDLGDVAHSPGQQAGFAEPRRETGRPGPSGLRGRQRL